MDKMILISKEDLDKMFKRLIRQGVYIPIIVDIEQDLLSNSKEVEVVDMNAEHIKYICKDKPDMFEYIKTNGYQLIKTKTK